MLVEGAMRIVFTTEGGLAFFPGLSRPVVLRKVSIALRQIVRCNSGTNPLVTALADTGQAWPTTDPASRGRCGG